MGYRPCLEMPDKKSRTATNSMITAGGKGRSRGARGTSNVSNYNAYRYHLHLELMYIGKDSEKNSAININKLPVGAKHI